MSIRIILARLTETTTETSVLDGALALAKLSGGHIDAMFVRSDPRTIIGLSQEDLSPAAYESLVSPLEREGLDRTRKIRKHFEEWRYTNDVIAGDEMESDSKPSAEWHEAVGNEREVLTRAARLSDVTVMTRPLDRIEDRLDPVLQAALSDTGRPLMLVPPRTHNNIDLSNILVAWNDSAEAARAVEAALPLLVTAEKVTVLTAMEGALDVTRAEALVDYLGKHGIHALVFRNNRIRIKSAEKLLLAAAKATKANVIVMGAYTHSRVREMVFGGVTRHMLTHAPIPVFMAH